MPLFFVVSLSFLLSFFCFYFFLDRSRNRVDSTPLSYSGDSAFDSRSGSCLSVVRLLFILFSPSDEFPVVMQLMPHLLHFTSLKLAIQHSHCFLTLVTRWCQRSEIKYENEISGFRSGAAED